MEEAKPRPYWHVDAKWITGILLILLLATTLLLFVLSKITNRENAVELGSLALATAFSREEGLDGTASIEEFKKEAANQVGDQLHPLPDIQAVVISRQDLETLSPREIRLKIFRQIVEPLYDKGVEGAAQQFTNDPAAQEKLANDASLLRVFTKSFHDRISSLLLLSVFITLVLLAGFIYFSFGWGRLGNPGALLFIVGLPGALVGLLMANPPTDGDGGPFKYIPAELGERIGSHLQLTYGSVAVVGFVLMLIALVGSVVSRKRK